MLRKDYVNKIKSLLKYKDQKLVIWFVGSFSSGKTTQCRLLLDAFSKDRIIVNKKFYMNINKEKKDLRLKASLFGVISNIGIVSDNACSGADTIPDSFSRKLSVNYCIKKSNIVLVDGAIFTNTWWYMYGKADKVLLVHLKHNSLEKNAQFLSERRRKSGKAKFVETFEERTYKNLEGQRKRGSSLFNKAEEYMRDVDMKIEIEADMDKIKINKIILKNIYKILKKN